MKITDPAKETLLEILEENKADGLLVGVQETCCGKSPVFQMAAFDENDVPTEINGIKIVIPEELKDAVDDLIIDMVNGELVVLNEVCGCGDGCGHCHHE